MYTGFPAICFRILPSSPSSHGFDHVHALVELGIHEPIAGGKSAVPTGLQSRFFHRLFEHGDLFFGQIRIVRPLHELIPDFGILPPVHVDFLVHEGQPLQRRHGAEDLPLFVDDAHTAFLVHVARGLFVEPHEVERTPLKPFPSLIATLKSDDRGSAEHVSDHDLIDDARLRVVLPPALHDDIHDPVGAEIVQNFFLRHVALNLRGERNHPPEHVFAVFAVRMIAAGEPDRLRRAALRFARAVSAEHPSVALLAFVKSDLLFMSDPARIVPREVVRLRSAGLFPLDRPYFSYYFVHFR